MIIIEIIKGQIVFSKCGHDKGKLYIVVSVSNDYLYLADGTIRTLQKVKKKKIKHVQPTNCIVEQISNKLKSNECTDFDLKEALKIYRSRV